MKPKKAFNRILRAVDKALTMRGWKIRPKVWVENEKVETNKGYFHKTNRKPWTGKE